MIRARSDGRRGREAQGDVPSSAGRSARESGAEPSPRREAPPLRPFGLVLRRDGTFAHEGVPITHRRLRTVFERSVRFLPERGKYVVQLGRYQGEVEVEEAGFFVRDLDAEKGTIALSDGTSECLTPASLRWSVPDGALLCRVKRELQPEGLLARFTHAAQAELLLNVEETSEGPVLVLAGRRWRLRAL